MNIMSLFSARTAYKNTTLTQRDLYIKHIPWYAASASLEMLHKLYI